MNLIVILFCIVMAANFCLGCAVDYLRIKNKRLTKELKQKYEPRIIDKTGLYPLDFCLVRESPERMFSEFSSENYKKAVVVQAFAKEIGAEVIKNVCGDDIKNILSLEESMHPLELNKRRYVCRLRIFLERNRKNESND